jgi:quercetin dioxygenase-like cupin family protein
VADRVHTELTAGTVDAGDGVDEHPLVPPRAGSALALSTLRFGPATAWELADPGHDTLLFTFGGTGTITVASDHDGIAAATAAVVADGEQATLTAGPEGLALVRMRIGADVDLHAPIGPSDRVVAVDHVEPGTATGSRSFQVLYGPHNGSTRATLFIGYIPPGRAPWHYHLYDEIVWAWRGPGRFHLDTGAEELPDGAAFRLAPRELHIVENMRDDAELAVLGVFTPAGSPSAAYLTSETAATYAIAPS